MELHITSFFCPDVVGINYSVNIGKTEGKGSMADWDIQKKHAKNSNKKK